MPLQSYFKEIYANDDDKLASAVQEIIDISVSAEIYLSIDNKAVSEYKNGKTYGRVALQRQGCMM